MLDRMDEALEFGLPHTDERKKILDLYLDRCGQCGGGEGSAVWAVWGWCGECCVPKRILRPNAPNLIPPHPRTQVHFQGRHLGGRRRRWLGSRLALGPHRRHAARP